MTSLTLKEGLQNIGAYAFKGCTSLTETVLPDSVTTMGFQAFANCTALTSINFPLNWTTASNRPGWNYSGEIFSGCTRLTTIVIPEGVTAIPAYAFNGCGSLRYVDLPSTLREIRDHAFYNCVKLKSIDLLDGLLSTGDYAFSGCADLESLYIPETVTSFGADVFNGCGNLTVECEQYSFATIYCMDAGIPLRFISDSLTNSDALLLDRSKTCYVANTVGALANGYVTLNLTYGYKESAAEAVSAQVLTIRIPKDMELIEKTLYLDGTLLTGYEYADRLLTISLTNTSGSLSFALRPKGDSTVTTYAVMAFKHGGEAKREVVGIINEKLPLLTIQAESESSSATVPVSGIGTAASSVDLYVDGVFAKTVKTRKSGSYSTTVTIPAEEDYTAHTITAKAADGAGGEISASKEVVYFAGAPAIQGFTVGYGGKTYDVAALGTVKPVAMFNAGNKFDFNVTFTNPEQVDKVFICSTRSNVTKRIEAVWNSETKSYKAGGWFDEANRSYVPGSITVEYTKKDEAVDFMQFDNKLLSRYESNLRSDVRAMLRGKAKDCLEDLVSTDKTLSGIIDMVDIDSQLDFNILTDIIPSYLDPEHAGEFGYEAVEDDKGMRFYLKISEFTEDKLRGEVIDFAHDKFVDFLIEGKYGNAAYNTDAYFSFMEVFGDANKVIKWDGNRLDIKKAKQAILASSMSPEEKAAALKKLENASKANNGVLACLVLKVVLTAAGISLPFPVSLILPLISLQNSVYVEDVLAEFDFLDALEDDSLKLDFLWKIDPSGYVYDAVTEKRLPDVTATLYWIPFDEKDEDTTPADTEYGTVWDAEEWDQTNPILTDAEGKYAWDVPEGWWRVKYEKAGYETVWSEWMTVPPEQTDVNIGMTATGAAVFEPALVSSTADGATVSLTYSGASGTAIVFVLAAYSKTGQMVIFETLEKTVDGAGSLELTLSYGDAGDLDCIKAFAISAETAEPLCAAWTQTIPG